MSEANRYADAYKSAGVDIAEADAGLRSIVRRIVGTWPPGSAIGGAAGGAASGIGAVQLPIGYFANVIDIGGIGLGICTDGVGSKAIVAERMRRYDTIGVDCVAMNVNDLLCVGAKPLSLVDYIAVEQADAAMLDGIAIGLAEGARQAGISICGGEIAQLRDVVRGFDLVGTAVGLVPLGRIITGSGVRPGDRVIGLASNGLHSNGYTLARRVLFDEAGLSVEDVVPELGGPLGDELLRPTFIYVPEILELIERVPDVGALIHITGDGLLNLPRVEAEIGFVLDSLPPPPSIFGLIEERGGIARAEMFEVYNMGVGFCAVLPEKDVEAALAILARHNRRAWVIGHAVADPEKQVHLPQHGLVGRGKRFRAA